MASRTLLISLAVAAAALQQLSVAMAGAATVAGDAWRNCTTSCGNISIPYPFGVERGCFLDGFDVTCDRSYLPPKLFLGAGAAEVTDIFVANGTVRISGGRVNISGLVQHNGAGGERANGTTWGGGFRAGGPYFLSENRNKLVVVACNVQVLLLGVSGGIVGACSAFCPPVPGEGAPRRYLNYDGGCSGVGCCQVTVPVGYASYAVQSHRLNGSTIPEDPDNFLYIAERGLKLNYTKHMVTAGDPPAVLPAVLDWVIGDDNSTCPENAPALECRSSQSYCQNSTAMGHKGYICRCSAGYDGNPYINNGCLDINECQYPETYPCYGDCKNTQGSYFCNCPNGYAGDASAPNGCKDIDECAQPDVYRCFGDCINLRGSFDCTCPYGTDGNATIKGGCISIKKSHAALYISLGVGVGSSLLLLVVCVHVIKHKFKLWKASKMKEDFFRQNHGLLLQQLLSQKADIAERMIITLEEIEKATNNFDRTRVVGGGGHGTVYKGILGLNVVAVKKSNIIVQKEIDDFINEVAILTQINHRNVVKLLGYCLETEVPLLVYEFISNGDLNHHLHTKGPSKLSWDDRLRIALETARALAYLHSAASIPIFHRDIKSSNILLDDNLTAKVSDFGASRYISIDRTEVTASIQGTMGYIDPMCYYTGILTDKSDVFSFGVLLVELLTRKKPFLYKSRSGDSLVAHFHSLLMEGNLVQIIDPQVMEEEDGRLQQVAVLAAMCTRLRREDRPTMRQVEMTLESLRASKKLSPHNASATRNDGQHIVGQRMQITIGRGLVREEGNRHYSMEEEFLLSAGYPR